MRGSPRSPRGARCPPRRTPGGSQEPAAAWDAGDEEQCQACGSRRSDVGRRTGGNGSGSSGATGRLSRAWNGCRGGGGARGARRSGRVRMARDTGVDDDRRPEWAGGPRRREAAIQGIEAKPRRFERRRAEHDSRGGLHHHRGCRAPPLALDIHLGHPPFFDPPVGQDHRLPRVRCPPERLEVRTGNDRPGSTRVHDGLQRLRRPSIARVHCRDEWLPCPMPRSRVRISVRLPGRPSRATATKRTSPGRSSPDDPAPSAATAVPPAC